MTMSTLVTIFSFILIVKCYFSDSETLLNRASPFPLSPSSAHIYINLYSSTTTSASDMVYRFLQVLFSVLSNYYSSYIVLSCLMPI